MQNIKYADLERCLSTAYDMQKLRIAVGNRICAAFRQKVEPSDEGKAENAIARLPEDEEHEVELPNQVEANEKEAKRLLVQLRRDYDRVTDGVLEVTNGDGSLRLPRGGTFKAVGNITSRAELILIQQYFALEAQENDHFKNLVYLLRGIPVYDNYLVHVKGIGPALSAILLRYFNLDAARYPSSFIKYAGLDVVTTLVNGEAVGRGRGMFKDHLVDREYTNSRGETTVAKSVTFNPYVRTKLLGVAAGSFLKAKSPYAEVYRNYIARLQNHPKYKDVSKIHRHRMALRYMMKQFLIDFFIAWREIEGKPYIPTYEEAKLGIIHGGGERRACITSPIYETKRTK